MGTGGHIIVTVLCVWFASSALLFVAMTIKGYRRELGSIFAAPKLRRARIARRLNWPTG